MGKKRRKSKGKKKRQKGGPSPDEVTSTVVKPSAESEDGADLESAVGLDADETVDDGDDPEEILDLDGDEDVVLDLDEDLDDPLARAELVAAVAGLEALSDTADEHDAAADEHDGTADEPETAAEKDAVAEEGSSDIGIVPTEEIEGAGTRDTDAEYGVADGADATPLIGPDALVALSEFSREGVATLPEELILDLGESTTPEERDRLLAAALAHVEMQDAIYRVPTESGASRRWKGLIATALFLMALFLVGLPPAFLVPEAPAPLTVSEQADGIRMALLMQAEQVEAFRARSGRLPTTISEVESALPGIRFVRSSNRLYQLIAYTPSGDAVVYDSASPDPPRATSQAASARLRGES